MEEFNTISLFQSIYNKTITTVPVKGRTSDYNLAGGVGGLWREIGELDVFYEPKRF